MSVRSGTASNFLWVSVSVIPYTSVSSRVKATHPYVHKDATLATRIAASASPLLGNFQEYHPENKLFGTSKNFLYSQKDRKVVVLIVISSKTYSLLKILVALSLPNYMSLDDLINNTSSQSCS